MKIIILTLYPEMFPGPLGHSLPGKGLKENRWSLEAINIRDFATDKHNTVDDTPYGGGAGMVMKPDVLAAAIDHAKQKLPEAKLIYFSPKGKLLQQSHVRELAVPNASFILLCGRFEGVDERLLEEYQPLEISIGDYVIFGGELAAMVFTEAMLRHIPGSVGNPETLEEESFSIGEKSALLLEYPHYTKPPFWKERGVPEVLTSGNHKKISEWRQDQAERITKERRPDLWNQYTESKKRT